MNDKSKFLKNNSEKEIQIKKAIEKHLIYGFSTSKEELVIQGKVSYCEVEYMEYSHKYNFSAYGIIDGIYVKGEFTFTKSDMECAIKKVIENKLNRAVLEGTEDVKIETKVSNCEVKISNCRVYVSGRLDLYDKLVISNNEFKHVSDFYKYNFITTGTFEEVERKESDKIGPVFWSCSAGPVPSIVTTDGMKKLKELELIENCMQYNHELFCFILYGDVESHTKLANFINRHGDFLDEISGNDCLIGLFENPNNWGSHWERKWKKRLGSNYKMLQTEWNKLDSSDRNASYTIANALGIMSQVPCMIFTTDFMATDFVVLSIEKNNNNFEYFFIEVFEIVQKCLEANSLGKEYLIKDLGRAFCYLDIKWDTKHKYTKISSKNINYLSLVDILFKIYNYFPK